MFDRDTWQEILDTIRSNRLRTLLTGFSVAWGILMLVLLLGSGNGLAHGVEYQFRDDAINSIWVSSGQTSMPYKGLQPGRRVVFTNDDYDAVRHGVAGVDKLTGRYRIQGNLTVSYGKESSSYDVRSVHPDHRYLEKTLMTEGRYLDQLDIEEFRKVAVIGQLVKDQLFKGKPALGQYIEVNGVPFQVVGVFTDEGGEGEQEKIYLPISTSQRTFGGANQVHQLMMTVGDATLAESQKIADTVRNEMAERHDFSVDDTRAVFINNNVENFQRFVALMAGIRGFVWVIGVGTLLAGVVGVSNILLIAVRERTKEIGIRKAVGATPRSILGLVLLEAVLITGVAGYVGLVLGVAILEGLSRGLPDSDFFKNPQVDLQVAIAATVLLIVAGAIAGFVPARRAAAIRPIEALRDE